MQPDVFESYVWSLEVVQSKKQYIAVYIDLVQKYIDINYGKSYENGNF